MSNNNQREIANLHAQIAELSKTRVVASAPVLSEPEFNVTFDHNTKAISGQRNEFYVEKETTEPEFVFDFKNRTIGKSEMMGANGRGN